LKNESLFKSRLVPDVVNRYSGRKDIGRDVFPAIRNNRIDFYHKGGKLFSYNENDGFSTHHKYASVVQKLSNSDYLTQNDLRAINDFEQGYERIKENCSRYSGDEAQGVARIYGKYSCAKVQLESFICVLDIEVSMRRDGKEVDVEPIADGGSKSDRIDLLLFDIRTKLLRFFEAKHYSNNDIRAEQSREPKIVSQMRRYSDQLKSNAVGQLMTAYGQHVKAINNLFEPRISLPAPEEIDPVPRLLIFGFDEQQRKGKVLPEVSRLRKQYGLSVYAKGDIATVDVETLFNGAK
jgi:hypothetical protein